MFLFLLHKPQFVYNSICSTGIEHNVNLCVICLEVDTKAMFPSMSTIEQEYRDNKVGPRTEHWGTPKIT